MKAERMQPRRAVLKALGGAALLGAAGRLAQAAPSSQPSGPQKTAPASYQMPDEGEPHAATWMAYGATAQAWGTSGAYGLSRLSARRDLMRIAVNLSRFETVNMLVSKADMAQARQLLAQAQAQPGVSHASQNQPSRKLPAPGVGGAVQLIEREVDDLWIRDTGPTFVRAGQQVAGVDFHFNGWGQEHTGAKGWKRDPEKARNGVSSQEISHDKRVAAYILERTHTPAVPTWLVMEGGGIEVDGHGTALCTESCILNPNRNPGRSKADVERELLRVLGVRKVIWLPGVRAQEITDGHIDFYARFVGPGRVVYGLDEDPDSSEYEVTHTHERLLKQATDAQGRPLHIQPLIAPDAQTAQAAVLKRNAWKPGQLNAETFAAGYIGFYLANGCVLMAEFGDPEADQAAFDTLAALYPERTIIQIPTDGLANGGGTIHCATQQQPR